MDLQVNYSIFPRGPEDVSCHPDCPILTVGRYRMAPCSEFTIFFTPDHLPELEKLMAHLKRGDEARRKNGGLPTVFPPTPAENAAMKLMGGV